MTKVVLNCTGQLIARSSPHNEANQMKQGRTLPRHTPHIAWGPQVVGVVVVFVGGGICSHGSVRGGGGYGVCVVVVFVVAAAAVGGWDGSHG